MNPPKRSSALDELFFNRNLSVSASYRATRLRARRRKSVLVAVAFAAKVAMGAVVAAIFSG